MGILNIQKVTRILSNFYLKMNSVFSHSDIRESSELKILKGRKEFPLLLRL